MAGVIVFILVALGFFLAGILSIALSPVIYDLVTRTHEVNYSLLFTTAESEYVNMGDQGTLDFGVNDFTTVARIKQTANTGAAQTILGKMNTTLNTNAGYRVTINGPTNVINATMADPTGKVSLLSTTVLNPGVWYHVAVVYDRDGLMTIYVNGQEAGTASIAGRPGLVSNTIDFNLARTAAGSSALFGGNIDDVFVFNRVLTPSEVLTLYTGGYISTGLVSYYDMNDGAGSILDDNVGVANGALVNTPEWSTDRDPTSRRTEELLTSSVPMVTAGFDDTTQSLYEIWRLSPLIFFFCCALFGIMAVRRRGAGY